MIAAEQDGQHDHRARHDQRRWRSSSASSRPTTTRAPRSSSTCRSSRSTRSRAKQFGLDLGDYTIQTVFSPEADPRGTTARPATARHAVRRSTRRSTLNTIYARHQHRRLLPGVPSAVVRFLETDSETQARSPSRSCAAPKGRRSRSISARKSRCRATTFTPVAQGGASVQPADVVQLPAGRRQRRDDAARDLRGRHHRSSCSSRTARSATALNVAGPEPAVVQLAQGPDAAAAARRRVEPAGRPAARGRAPVAARASRACCGCRSSGSCSRRTTTPIGQTDIVMLLTPRIVRTHELTQQRRQPDLHRHAAEPRPRRAAAADRARKRCPPGPPARLRRGRPAGAGPRRRVPSPAGSRTGTRRRAADAGAHARRAHAAHAGAATPPADARRRRRGVAGAPAAARSSCRRRRPSSASAAVRTRCRSRSPARRGCPSCR